MVGDVFDGGSRVRSAYGLLLPSAALAYSPSPSDVRWKLATARRSALAASAERILDEISLGARPTHARTASCVNEYYNCQTDSERGSERASERAPLLGSGWSRSPPFPLPAGVKSALALMGEREGGERQMKKAFLLLYDDGGDAAAAAVGASGSRRPDSSIEKQLEGRASGSRRRYSSLRWSVSSSVGLVPVRRSDSSNLLIRSDGPTDRPTELDVEGR